MTPAHPLPKERTIMLTHDTWTDLANRESDGLEITLLWSQESGRVKVVVDDVKLGESFELDVPQAEALAAFHHPFAYARDRKAHQYVTTDLQLQT